MRIVSLLSCVLIVVCLGACRSGHRSSSSSSSTSSVSSTGSQSTPGSSTGGGVSSVGTLTMNSSVGQAISGVKQTSASGRFERN